MKTPTLRQTLSWASACACIAVLMAGCASKPPVVAPPAPLPAPVAPPAVVVAPPAPFYGETSTARTPRDYRRDAASHLYAANKARIYHGKMPPLLYAVGVFQVQIDSQGNVVKTQWMRAPTQAPEVMADIERSVRQAAPYPAPVLMGSVTYTDTWLWHKSGRFQLDTLTEGQM